ncbi:MAG: imidazole glycerol phosphate synthase subunit HisH [Bacillota bacterium]
MGARRREPVDIAIVDYGRGNLRSVQAALSRAGARPFLAADPAAMAGAAGVILPGVGSFHDAVTSLAGRGFVDALVTYAASGRPLLGLCLGMQLLFETADEGGSCSGLGLFRGHVARLEGTPRLPHIGWNLVRRRRPSALLDGEAGHFFFVHSYAARGVDDAYLTATTDYGVTIPAVVENGNIMGTQFHPERSGGAGLVLFERFLEVVRRCS